MVTCTLDLVNAGIGDAPGAMVTNPLPADAALVPGSLAWVGGGAAEALTGTVRWAGPLSGGARVTLIYELALPTNPVHPPPAREVSPICPCKYVLRPQVLYEA